jgi:hypothetical protein
MPKKGMTSMPAKAQKRSMSAQHKAALAEGRAQGRAVANYLDALEAHRPKRGRKRTADTVKRQLAEANADLKEAIGSQRLELIQRRRDLEDELDAMESGGADLPALEKDFVKVAKGYAARKGISYGAFREFGVPAEVLAKAGITRGS